MRGHRGCRLAVTYPEIAAMQTRAVIKAAINVAKKHPNWKIVPEIMIPLVGEIKELKYVKNIVVETADELIKKANSSLKYKVGTMIEIPRAALTADEIAKEAAFFSFGTNDLTQMTFGFSRDDAGKFLDAYYDKKIFENDPFAKLDQVGVGSLMKMAAEKGKSVNKDLHLGICGEHGGDPSSVEFCHKIGLDYVSCSPFRVPIARLAAAQAAIAEDNTVKGKVKKAIAKTEKKAKKVTKKAKASAKKAVKKAKVVAKKTVKKAKASAAKAKAKAKRAIKKAVKKAKKK